MGATQLLLWLSEPDVEKGERSTVERIRRKYSSQRCAVPENLQKRHVRSNSVVRNEFSTTDGSTATAVCGPSNSKILTALGALENQTVEIKIQKLPRNRNHEITFINT